MIDELRLGTRGSQLALWQAHAVAERIAGTGGPSSRIVIIKTSGDRQQEAPLSEIGGKRLFVKEIEDALFRGEIDLAVHSSKDMPVLLPDGLTIAGVLPREDPLDAMVLPRRAEGSGLSAIQTGLSTALSPQPSALTIAASSAGGVTPTSVPAAPSSPRRSAGCSTRSTSCSTPSSWRRW